MNPRRPGSSEKVPSAQSLLVQQSKEAAAAIREMSTAIPSGVKEAAGMFIMVSYTSNYSALLGNALITARQNDGVFDIKSQIEALNMMMSAGGITQDQHRKGLNVCDVLRFHALPHRLCMRSKCRCWE